MPGWVVGVDGCPAEWFAVALDTDGAWVIDLVPGIDTRAEVKLAHALAGS